MTIRLLILLVLVGGIIWLRWRMRARAAADRNRSTGGLPPVPAALRGGSSAWVIFTTPTCVACRSVERMLAEHRPGERVVRVDATTDPELAQRWKVQRAPTTLLADNDGTVVARLVGAEAVRKHLAKSDPGVTDSEPIPDAGR
jgi:thiol-disulfide isomerase/thioredoxin